MASGTYTDTDYIPTGQETQPIPSTCANTLGFVETIQESSTEAEEV